MSRNNDVFQVLIPTSATIAPVGSSLDDLALGQLGAFSYETNLALDAPAGRFYWAVGIDNTGANAEKNDVAKSAGTHIQAKNMVNQSVKCYTAPVDMVTNNIMKVFQCGQEIGVKIEIRNQEAYRVNGYNQVVKNYVVPTSDCVDCDTACEDANCVAVLDSLIDLINSDPDGVVTASKTDPTDCTTGDGVLILTVNPAEFKSFCDINLNYFFPHQTEIIVTPLGGFEATTVATEMVYEDGSGYDVKQLEYEAGGWNGRPGPYRTYEFGLAKNDFLYFADASKKYDIVHQSYDQESQSGWRFDKHNQRTVIATAIDGGTGGNLSEVIHAFINTMTAGYADPIVPCDNTP